MAAVYGGGVIDDDGETEIEVVLRTSDAGPQVGVGGAGGNGGGICAGDRDHWRGGYGVGGRRISVA